MSDRSSLEKTFERLHGDYRSRVTAMARGERVPERDLEDVVQDVFDNVWRALLANRGPVAKESELAWMRSVTHNFLRNRFRSRSSLTAGGQFVHLSAEHLQETVGWELSPPEAQEDSPEIHAWLGERKRLLWAEIGRLPPKCRAVCWAFYSRQKSLAEISRELGIAVGTVKAHLKVGRDILRLRVDPRLKS